MRQLLARDHLGHAHFSSTLLLICRARPRALAPSALILFSCSLCRAQKIIIVVQLAFSCLIATTYRSPEHCQCAVSLQGMPKSFGSFITNVVAFKAVKINLNDMVIVNNMKFLMFCNSKPPVNNSTGTKHLSYIIGANGLKHIKKNSTGYSLQRGQRAVGLQGLCKSLGSVSADLVAGQAVYGTSKHTNGKE